jgi:hypothetical protein
MALIFIRVPPYLDSIALLESMTLCENVRESIDSILEYQEAIGLGLGFDVDNIRGKRPFELLKVPRSALSTSRIVRQAAGLIIPDQVLNEYWSSDAVGNRAPNSKTVQGVRLIEDLSCSRDVSVFRFSHSIDNKHLNTYTQDYLFPEDDISKDLSRWWYRAYYYRNNFGTHIIKDRITTLLFGDDPFLDPEKEFLL